jgi:hypothetical protein
MRPARAPGSPAVSGVRFAVVVVCSAASILIRFRRARGLQRQQLKWLAYAVAVATVALVLASREWAGWAVAQVVTLVAVGFIPVAIGVAILRHRLFDIDRLISNTLVYGLLTALLAGTYATGVFVAGRLLDPAQGRSGLAVAASILAVAALFQPLRRRIQNLVDRRFYRSRYDAARTVEGTVALSDHPVRLPPFRRANTTDHRHGRVVRPFLGALP